MPTISHLESVHLKHRGPGAPNGKNFIFSAMPHSLRDLSSLIRDRTQAPCNGSAES